MSDRRTPTEGTELEKEKFEEVDIVPRVHVAILKKPQKLPTRIQRLIPRSGMTEAALAMASVESKGPKSQAKSLLKIPDGQKQAAKIAVLDAITKALRLSLTPKADLVKTLVDPPSNSVEHRQANPRGHFRPEPMHPPSQEMYGGR